MNPYEFISLCATALSLILGLIVYTINRKATVNKLFMFMMFLNSYWAFCTYMLSSSPTLVGAVFWNKALFLWPVLIALMLHFSLAFAESELLKNKLVYVALYFPALLLGLIDLTTDLISTTPVLMPWGYAPAFPPNSVISRLDGIWLAVVSLLAILVLLSYHSKVIDKKRKQQTKFIVLGLGIPVILTLTSDTIFFVSGTRIPVIGNISGTVTSILTVYAMFRYELFSFRLEVAAENVFSTMPDSLVIADLEGKILKVNKSLLDLSGYREQEIIGKSIKEMLDKANVTDKNSQTPRVISQLRTLREIRDYEFAFYTKAGQTKNCLLSCSVVSDNRGQDVGDAFVFHDITERKLMEQKLLRAERFASIGELAGMLGHDLRNPLSGIRGGTYYLRKKFAKKLDAEDAAIFDSMDKSIDYSNKIVNDLLDYSTEIRLQLASVTPKGLIRDSLALIQPAPNIKVVDETPDNPAFEADEIKVCRVFVNIIKNAFDAMPNGGELQIKCQTADDKLLFTFRDSGMGMTEETIGKLWTPLYTTKAKGMGFGLAICKRHVEAHDGTISIESVLEKGTTVKVELPTKRVAS